MPDTPESLVKTYNPLARANVREPYIATTAAAAQAVTIYDVTQEAQAKFIWVRNLGTSPLKYAINQDCSDLAFHDIISADSGGDQGDGGKVKFELHQSGIKKISLFCQAAAVRASVEKHVRRI